MPDNKRFIQEWTIYVAGLTDDALHYAIQGQRSEPGPTLDALVAEKIRRDGHA